MIYHHEHNHYDVFNVISFTVIDDSLDDMAIQNVSITIVIMDCHISFIFVCHFVFQMFLLCCITKHVIV